MIVNALFLTFSLRYAILTASSQSGVCMHRERVSDNVYWFQSEVYAQVTAGAITGPQWAVVIDTLALPEETREMRDFLEDDLGIPVRYVINTHSHADHPGGTVSFPVRP